MDKLEPKKYLTLPYKNYVKKKNCRYSSQKKAPNTTLKKLCQEKKMHRFEPEKYLTLHYKNFPRNNIA